MCRLKYIIILIIYTLMVSFAFSKSPSDILYIDNAVKKSDRFPTLEESSNTGTYHLITHGRPGHLLINGQWMNVRKIVDFVKPKIQHPASGIRHLNIYGCEFAKGEKGKKAVKYLEEKLDVKVAASDDVTGKNGDWLLEYGNKDVLYMSKIIEEDLQCAGIRGGTNPEDDYDADGVCNESDLDDDNDGILDVDEGLSCTTPTKNTTLVSSTHNIPAEGTSYCGGLKNSYTHFSNGWLDTQNDITGTYSANYTYSGLDTSKPATFEHRLVYSNVNGSHGVNPDRSDIRITSKIYLNNTLVRTAVVSGWDYHSQPSEKDIKYFSFTPTTSSGTVRVQITFERFNGYCDHLPEVNFGYTKITQSGEVACNSVDTDGDGIPDHLDLDSDGDGCPDALEGNQDIDNSKLVESDLSGGNSGDDYQGVSTIPVSTNLGNVVDSDGVPNIVEGGQEVGSSQDIEQIAPSCETCNELSGTVKDGQGNTIEDVTIRVYADFDKSGNFSSGDELLTTVNSDTQGQYAYNKNQYLTVEDDFSGSVFSGTNNSSGDYNAWLDASWSQSNSSNSGISSGTNTDDGLSPSQHIYIHNGTQVYRAVNLSKFETAYLRFDYDTENDLDATDKFHVELSKDGGTTYTTVYTYTDGNVDNQPVRSQNININEYAGESNVVIRFRSESGSAEYIWLDNVTIYTAYPQVVLKPVYNEPYRSSNPEEIKVNPTSDSCSELDFELLDACDVDPTDTDSDGICDAIDIDDDNDGVLDKTEGHFCGKLDRNIVIGYLDSGVGNDGLATDMLLNLNNFGEYGTYDKVNGVVLVPFSSSSDITESNLLANNIDIFFAGSSGSYPAGSSDKLSTATNATLKNWAENHDKGLFILQNNAVDYGYTLTNNDVPPDVPNGDIGYQVYTNGYWPVSSLTQTGTVKLTTSSNTRSFEAVMVDSKSQHTLIKDNMMKLVVFPDATIYNDEANTVDPNKNDATKVIADTWAFVIDTFIGDLCTELDTDGDGIPNHLDLDSDGDGCSDAFEANATDEITPNFQFAVQEGTASDTNSDGLADAVDANLNGIPDYVSSYNPEALDDSTCTDSDGDGIVDSVDLDDDNDGILDIDEGLVCVEPEQGEFKIGYVDTTVGRTGLMANMLTNPANFGPDGVYSKIPNVALVPYAIADVTEERLLDDQIDVFYLGSSNDGDYLNQTGSNSQKLPSTLNNIVRQWGEVHNKAVLVVQNNAIDFDYRIVNNNVNPDTPYDALGESVMTNGYWPVNSFNQTGTVQLTASSAIEKYDVVMTDKNGKATLLSSKNTNMVLLPDATIMKDNSSQAIVSTDILKVVANIHAYLFDLFLATPQCKGIDTDNDGIPNHLDLDSDGDSCPDIKEAGVVDYLKSIGKGSMLASGEVTNGNGSDDTQNTTSTMGDARMEISNNGDTVGPNNGFHDTLEQTETGVYDNTPYNIDPYLDFEDKSACSIRKIYSNPAMHTYRKPKQD